MSDHPYCYTELISHLLSFMPMPVNFAELLIPHLTEPISYIANVIVLKPEETADLAFWLAKGYMRAYIEVPVEPGLFKQKTIDIWKAGMINLPVHSYMNQEPVNYYLEVTRGSEVIGFKYQSFMELGLQMPEIKDLALKIIGAAQKDWLVKLDMCKVKSLEGYLNFLNHFGLEVEEHIDQKHIAGYIGMSAETLSRLRG